VFAKLANLQLDAISYRSGTVRVHGFMVSGRDGVRRPTLVYARGGGASGYPKRPGGPRCHGRHGAAALLHRPDIAETMVELAVRGFTVVETQYRDEPEGRDEFGGGEVADIVNLQKVFEAIPEADPVRTGIIGW